MCVCVWGGGGGEGGIHSRFGSSIQNWPYLCSSRTLFNLLAWCMNSPNILEAITGLNLPNSNINQQYEDCNGGVLDSLFRVFV